MDKELRQILKDGHSYVHSYTEFKRETNTNQHYLTVIKISVVFGIFSVEQINLCGLPLYHLQKYAI